MNDAQRQNAWHDFITGQEPHPPQIQEYGGGIHKITGLKPHELAPYEEEARKKEQEEEAQTDAKKVDDDVRKAEALKKTKNKKMLMKMIRKKRRSRKIRKTKISPHQEK